MTAISCGKQLKQLRIQFSKGEEYLLKDLFEKYKTIRYLEIDFYESYDSRFDKSDGNVFKYGLEQISTLNHLIYLYISNRRHTLNEKLFFNSFKQLTQNCTQLKSIKCDLKLSSDQNLYQLLSPLKALKQLKRLTLTLQYNGKKK